MNPEDVGTSRPDIVAATRGGDSTVAMDGEGELSSASLEQALFWRKVYTEILAMEESVLDRIHELMAAQSPPARREVELTNVPVVVSQVARFRARGEMWEARVRAQQGPMLPSPVS